MESDIFRKAADAFAHGRKVHIYEGVILEDYVQYVIQARILQLFSQVLPNMKNRISIGNNLRLPSTAYVNSLEDYKELLYCAYAWISPQSTDEKINSQVEKIIDQLASRSEMLKGYETNTDYAIDMIEDENTGKRSFTPFVCVQTWDQTEVLDNKGAGVVTILVIPDERPKPSVVDSVRFMQGNDGYASPTILALLGKKKLPMNVVRSVHPGLMVTLFHYAYNNDMKRK